MRQAFCGKGIEMIIWAASFPRSGNTFCRVAMHRLYGLSTYVGVGSGEDLATYGAEELVGLRPPPPKLAAALRHAPVDYGNEVFTPGPELLDALEEMERSDEIFQERLYSISMKRWVREAGWRTWHASYLEVDPEFERTALVMFDDLVRDPVTRCNGRCTSSTCRSCAATSVSRTSRS
jgi:hypothetical protein